MGVNINSFTSSMRLLKNKDDPLEIEQFYYIEGSTVIFDADLVDTTSVIKSDTDEVSVRMNLKDGTHVDVLFEITSSGITDRLYSENTRSLTVR